MSLCNNELVSIVTPSYKSIKFIDQTIESVLNQTYKKWEMIIVDDASPDNSNGIIERYIKKDSRIKLIKLEKNSGPAVARNRAIKEANGGYIAFLDADDLWMSEKLEKQIKFMNDNDLVMTYCAYETIDKNGKKINTRNIKANIEYKDILKSNHIGNLTGIYDCNKLGKYYMDDVGHEDYTLWLKILKDINETKGIKEPLAKYRILSNSISANKLKSITWTWRIYRRVINLNIIQSCYYMVWYIYYGLKKRSY